MGAKTKMKMMMNNKKCVCYVRLICPWEINANLVNVIFDMLVHVVWPFMISEVEAIGRVICVMIHDGIHFHVMFISDVPGRFLSTHSTDSFDICGFIIRCQCAFRQVLFSGYNDVACLINRFIRE